MCCRRMIHTFILMCLIYKTMQEDPDGGWKNEQITTALWDELIAELHGLCRVAAEVNIL